MSKLSLHKNKILRLTNVVIRDISLEIKNIEGAAVELQKIVELMDNYIKSKGAAPVGPLIQHTNSNIGKNGELEMNIKIMRQANNYILNTEAPYKAKSVIRAKDCMYVRYTGPESKIKFAYDKIMLTAFEEDIPLKGDSYTIFVDQKDDIIIADVFMERADNE